MPSFWNYFGIILPVILLVFTTALVLRYRRDFRAAHARTADQGSQLI